MPFLNIIIFYAFMDCQFLFTFVPSLIDIIALWMFKLKFPKATIMFGLVMDYSDCIFYCTFQNQVLTFENIKPFAIYLIYTVFKTLYCLLIGLESGYYL